MEYHGFRRVDFELNGHEGTVIFPHTVKRGNPWIWRAEFLGAFDNADVELLRRGWHLAYYKISDMYGCPQAVEKMRGFYQHVRASYGLAEQTILFGFSRGGLYTLAFAGKYPHLMQAVYLDAPALDVFRWPLCPAWAGRGEAADCRRRYGLAEGATESPDNPVNQLPVLIEHRIPAALICGLADEAVPYELNGKLLADAYESTDIPFFKRLKPHCGHHPHGLDDPTELADWIDGL